jgi:hypothetical protein
MATATPGWLEANRRRVLGLSDRTRLVLPKTLMAWLGTPRAAAC